MHQSPGDKTRYFAGAEAKANFVKGPRILRQWEETGEVSTFYEPDIETQQGAATMAMSEWHTLRDGRIASTFMVFDGNAEAVDLLRNALGGHG